MINQEIGFNGLQAYELFLINSKFGKHYLHATNT
jgi:hypothetical protein